MLLSLLIITIFSLLIYAPFIPFLGFYGDDWFFTYIGHFYGFNGLLESKVMERPITGYVHAINYFLLGANVFLWHIAMLIVNLFSSYILFFSLKRIWPRRLLTVTSLTILFSLYPGFLQSPSSPAYLPVKINMAVWITSLAFSIYAVGVKSRLKFILLTLIALTFQILSFLILEYFLGLEILRLALILYIVKTKTVKKIFLQWLPYLFGLFTFVFWRVVLFHSTRNETNISWVLEKFYTDPFWLVKIPFEILYGLASTVLFAYFIPIIIRIPRIPLEFSIIALFSGIISAGLFYFYYNLLEKSKYNQDFSNTPEIKELGKNLLVIGLISVLGALTLIIVSGRPVRLFSAYDRYTVTSIIGVSFIIIGFLFFKITPRLRKLILISIIALSITTHTMNGYLYTINWEQQKNIWWQLYWRAPRIKNNAMLIFDFPPLTQKNLFSEIINKFNWYRVYWVNYQIYGPANLFFNYDNLSKHNINGDYLLNKDVITKIREKTTEQADELYATYIKGFDKNHLSYYQNTVIIVAPSDNSCLWVMDKEDQILPNNASETLKSNIIYSDTSKLVENGTPINPPASIFGPEPPKTWCYFFQKASLARQLKKWDKLSQLKKEVLQKNLKPKDPNEWLVFENDIR